MSIGREVLLHINVVFDERRHAIVISGLEVDQQSERTLGVMSEELMFDPTSGGFSLTCLAESIAEGPLAQEMGRRILKALRQIRDELEDVRELQKRGTYRGDVDA